MGISLGIVMFGLSTGYFANTFRTGELESATEVAFANKIKRVLMLQAAALIVLSSSGLAVVYPAGGSESVPAPAPTPAPTYTVGVTFTGAGSPIGKLASNACFPMRPLRSSSKSNSDCFMQCRCSASV